MSEIDCVEQYDCNGEQHPIDGAVYTPYVELTVYGQKVLMTGNRSAPGEIANHAAIQSFQYGTTMGQGGCGIKVEIVDEGGVLYKNIVKNLNADITKALSPLTGVNSCKAKFGWVVKRCDGLSGDEPITNESTPCGQGGGELWFLPKNIQTTFDNGIIKFVFEAQDLFVRAFDARLEKAIGDESNKTPLKDALIELFSEKDPKHNPPKFLNKDGQEGFEFANSDGGDRGPRSVWAPEQESNVACARKWLNNVKTSNDKGVLIEWDPCEKRIVFQEDPVDKECCSNLNIGTFIVNGGNLSPVLSFAPQVEWPLGANAGSGGTPAGSSSGNSGNDVKTKEMDPIQNTGTQTSQNIPNDQDLWRDPNEQGEKTMENFSLHNNASKPWEQMVKPIEAELKIFGNPKYVNPIFYTGKFMSIVVVDPYYFDGGGDNSQAGIDGGTCTWISQPDCNPILSNKRWMILGVDHQISSGSYVTTFKVRLDVPNVNIPGGEPIGGCGTEFASESDPTPPAK